jgi:hypothetical protein
MLLPTAHSSKSGMLLRCMVCCVSGAADLLPCLETPQSPATYPWWALHRRRCVDFAVPALLLSKLLCFLSVITAISGTQKATGEGSGRKVRV